MCEHFSSCFCNSSITFYHQLWLVKEIPSPYHSFFTPISAFTAEGITWKALPESLTFSQKVEISEAVGVTTYKSTSDEIKCVVSLQWYEISWHPLFLFFFFLKQSELHFKFITANRARRNYKCREINFVHPEKQAIRGVFFLLLLFCFVFHCVRTSVWRE